jgi:hypothetical protein
MNLQQAMPTNANQCHHFESFFILLAFSVFGRGLILNGGGGIIDFELID